MKPIELTKKDFLVRVFDYEQDGAEWQYAGEKPALIDFYAPWCAPCRTVDPILEQLGEEYGDKISIYKVNIETEQELASVFNIQSVPSLLFIPMKGQPSIARGAIAKEEFVRYVDEILLNKMAAMVTA